MISVITKIIKQIQATVKKKLGNKLILISCQSTSFILFAFCAIITSQQYFGQPIQCIQDVNSDSASIPEHVMNAFCFISYTYGIVDFRENGRPTDMIEYPTKHSYYTWIPILIFVQGLSFMFLPVLWAINENSYLVHCLHESTVILGQDSLLNIARYVSKRLNDFRSWATYTILSEITFAVNIMANFLIIDAILGGRFLYYGYEALLKKEIYGENIFPKMTKCSFFKYGPSGTIEHRDALCLMPLNVLNEKLYLFLWFWFILLLCLSFLILALRIFYVFVVLFRRKWKGFIKKVLANDISQRRFLVLINKLSFSDWLLFEQIKSRMDINSYFKLLENIANEISDPQDLYQNEPLMYFMKEN